MKENLLTRDSIIRTLTDELKPLNYVHAFWEGGAIAFNRIDQWSDIDLYAAVDEDKVQETFNNIEKALKILSSIEKKLEVPQLPWPGISQIFYKLKNASEYLLIDFVVIQLSAPDKLLEPEIHGNIIFYFNKNNKIIIPHLDKDDFAEKISARLKRLKLRFCLFNIFVQKEINRGNSLEAIDLYQNMTLATLVEVLRIKHNPFHYNFRMRYIHYELPPKIVKKLEHLYFVKDMESLKEKYLEATEWFYRVISEIETS
ncbi:MAG: hypothetical protein QHH24_07840 [Candidatus Bathyarchaeota archaeon]|nr:hypothetical protein [Candidatus Bathyarchaeota archaeon]